MTGALTWGTLQFLAGAIAGASTNIQNVFSTFSSIADQSLFLTDLVEFLRSAAEDSLQAGRAAGAARRSGTVSCSKRSRFLIPAAERRVLDRLDFRIEPGERIALIGENGQGKTTLVKLLTRLYDPTGGRILLDGVDLREYSIEDLHSQIGVIFQDFMRYEMTARQNIAVGASSGWTTTRYGRRRTRAWRTEVVGNSCRTGYDQLLGRRFEGGVDLSGGEWQKMALARAYFRDAQVVILDEPTASLDARSEYRSIPALRRTDGGTSMALLISHRFSTVRMADRIVVLEDGRIAEQGSHDNWFRWEAVTRECLNFRHRATDDGEFAG